MDEDNDLDADQANTTTTTFNATDSNHNTQIRMLHSDSHQTHTQKPDPEQNVTSERFAVENRWIPSFIACGDLSAWDSDASYALPPDYVNLDPVQPPTAPPYRRALEMRKEKGGAYGKTKLGAVGRA